VGFVFWRRRRERIILAATLTLGRVQTSVVPVCPALSPLPTKFLKVPMTNNLLILSTMPALAKQEVLLLLPGCEQL